MNALKARPHYFNTQTIKKSIVKFHLYHENDLSVTRFLTDYI